MSKKRRSNFIDETGKVYGKLHVIAPIKRPQDRKTMFYCECECGNTIICNGSELRAGKRTSCGKHCNSIKDETGKKYGYLLVIGPDKQNNERGQYWICKCENCGNIVSINGKCLRNGDTRSCGCIKSSGEKVILDFFKEKKYNFIYQYKDPNFRSPLNNKPYTFDFSVLKEDNSIKYLIEYQGLQHFQQIKYFGNKLEQIQHNDTIKYNYCKENNIPILYICANKSKNIQYEDIIKIIKDYEENLDNVKISYYNI